MGYSNLAYAWENDRYENEINEKRRQINAKKKKEINKSRVLIVGYVFMIILSAVFMIGKNVAEYESSLKIKSLQKELAELQSYTSQKVFEMEENIDLTKVEEIAVNRLGMQRPSKNQTVYVNIKQDDVCELTADEVEGVGKRVVSAAEGLKKNVLGIFGLK